MALGAVAAEGDFRVALGAVAAEGDGRVALGAVAAEGDGHAALDAVGTALERFSRRPRGDRPGEVIRAEMMAWRRLIDRMELEFSGMVTELAGCDEDEWEGCPSPTAWIKQACRTTGTAAWNALVVGEQAARMPASARALRDGQIGYAHLALMARTAAWIGGLPAVAGVPAPRFDEGALLARARVGSVAELRRDCAHLRHAADPRRFLTEQVEEVEARFLELKATEGGALFLRGYLDTEGGATLRTALEPLARPAGVGDGRSRERRFADALVELAGHALDSGALPQHAGQRPHLQVTASLATSGESLVRRPPSWSWAARSRPRRRAGWAATPGSPGWCSAPTRRSSTWAGRPGCRRPRPAGRSRPAIGAASGPAATVRRPGASSTISATGPRGARPILPTSSRSAGPITGGCMREAGD